MFSTGNITAKIESEKEVTIEELVAEGDAIWKKCNSRKIKFGNLEASEILLNEMRKEHPEFSKSYPIVLRYMCQMQEYTHKAFELYLKKIKEHPWTSEAEYLDSQADYVILLYKSKHKRYNQTQINTLRNNIRTMLQNEHEVFNKYAKTITAEVEHEEEGAKRKKIENMREWYAKHGTECLNIQLRSESDISTENNVNIEELSKSIQCELTKTSEDLLNL
jgi:hypothetical protein